MMNGMGGMMGACMGGLGALPALMGVAWAGAGAAIVYALRHSRGVPHPAVAASVRGDAALATLRDRFARGEIDRAEYEERCRTLTGDVPQWP